MTRLEDFFVCPMCKGGFAREAQALVCKGCRNRYRIAGEIPILIPQGQEPADVPDPGIPFTDACELADHLNTVEGDFGRLVDEYYECLRTRTTNVSHLFEYYRDIMKKRRVAEVAEETGMISLAMDLFGCHFPHVRRAVEFGCGWGFSLAAVAKSRKISAVLQDAVLCGFDLNPSILVVAQRLFRDLGLENIQLAVADAQLPLAFPPKSIDMIYSNGVVEHILKQDALMTSLSEVLSDDSVLHFLIPNRYMIHPEPHYNIRGVGFFPRKWQPSYIGWRLGVAGKDICEILSYSPTDLANLMGRHFTDGLLAVIPSRPPFQSDRVRSLACRFLGLMAVNSYHCVVRRTAAQTKCDALRGKLQLSSILTQGNLRVAKTIAPVAA